MTRKYRTSALTTEGTSPIAATTKKKSKSKGIFKAVTVAALGAAGLSALGGWGGGTGMTFLSGLTKGWGKATGSFGSLFGVSQAATAPALSTTGSLINGAGGHRAVELSSAASTSTTGSLLSSAGSGLKGIFDSITNMSSGGAFTFGAILDAIGQATDSSGEDLIGLKEKALEAEIAMHEDMMDYRHAALEAEAHAAQQDLEMKNRVAAQSGTFMGHSNPITSGADGVPSTSPGYTPKPAASFSEFHPTGGLLS